jgi:hypothetical protein
MRMGVTTCCRCSTCGPTCSPPRAGNYALVPPGWSGSLPADVVRRAGYKITPLSHFGMAAEPAAGVIDADIDMTPPKVQVDTMPAGKFFAYAAEIPKLQPPHLTDQPILAQMRRIGIERCKSFDIDSVDPAIKAGLTSAPEDALKLMAWKIASIARVENGWSMNTDTMGVYGNYYLKRAIVAQLGLGANLPEDAIYPLNLMDDTGKPNGWGQFVYPPFRQRRRSNTIPTAPSTSTSRTPARAPTRRQTGCRLRTGAFNLTMRLCAPTSDALTGKWNPPPVTRKAV